MATTIAATYHAKLSVVQTVSGASAADQTVTFDGYSQPSAEAGSLTASTSVPVTKHAKFQLTLSSGSGSINLAALTGINSDETVVGTGLKLQLAIFANPSTNANAITVAKGASNGYGLGASGDTWTVTLSPGQSVMLVGADANPDVASGARVLDVTGTGSQVLNCHLVLG